MAACNVCLKRVLPHSYFLACNLCNSKIHINCMHKVTKNDSIYTQKEEHTWFCTDCVGNIFPYCHLYEDDEFMSALSENWNTKNQISLEALQNQNNIFSPFELNEISDSPLYDADPDIQFYQNQCHRLHDSIHVTIMLKTPLTKN